MYVYVLTVLWASCSMHKALNVFCFHSKVR